MSPPLRLDLKARIAFRGNEQLTLTKRAFDVLALLYERRPFFVQHDDLVAAVWSGRVVQENNLQVQIWTLRKALGKDAIVSQSGKGYRLILDCVDVPQLFILPFRILGVCDELQHVVCRLEVDLPSIISSRSKAVVVIAGEVAASRMRDTPDLSSLARKDGIHYFLEAVVTQAKTSLQVSVSISDAARGVQLWTSTFYCGPDAKSNTNTGEFVAPQIANAVVRHLLADAASRLPVVPAPSALALSAFLDANQMTLANINREETYARDLLARNPEDPKVSGMLASTLIHKNLFLASDISKDVRDALLAEGFALAKHAITLCPTEIFAYTALGTYFAFLGQIETAIQFERVRVIMEPHNPKGYVNLAASMLTKGNPISALALLDTSVQLDPDRTSEFSHHYRGRAELELGDTKHSIKAFHAAIEKNAEVVDSYFWLAIAYHLTGDEGSGARYAEMCRSLDHAYAGPKLDIPMEGSSLTFLNFWRETVRPSASELGFRL